MTNVENLCIEEVLDIPTLTARAAARWGDRTALIFDQTEQHLSFNTVESESNRIANALIARGVNPGDRIALMLRNRAAFPLCWLGIVKAGAVMVLLN